MFPTSYSLIGPEVLLTTWFIIKGLQNMVIQIISELPYTIKSRTPRQDRNINSNIYHGPIIVPPLHLGAFFNFLE